MDNECIIVHFTPTIFDRLQIKLETFTSNFTQASAELFIESTSRFRRQVGEIIIGGLTAIVGTAVEHWINKSRMVIQLFCLLY